MCPKRKVTVPMLAGEAKRKVTSETVSVGKCKKYANVFLLLVQTIFSMMRECSVSALYHKLLFLISTVKQPNCQL